MKAKVVDNVFADLYVLFGIGFNSKVKETSVISCKARKTRFAVCFKCIEQMRPDAGRRPFERGIFVCSDPQQVYAQVKKQKVAYHLKVCQKNRTGKRYLKIVCEWEVYVQ